jgi:cytochrome c-type protein NapC
MLGCLLFLLIMWWAGMGTVQGQFKQNKDTIKIDPSGFPADIQKGYRLFSTKCSECHGLDTSLKPTMSASQWTAEVKRMQGMPSSQFNDAQAKAIVDFLNYYGAHRKPPDKQDDQSAGSASGSAGSQFYDTQGCATCHAISGTGGTSGPSLSDVGKRLSKDQLTEKIQEIRTGKSSMPPLPADTTDEQVKELVDFLASLGNNHQKKTDGKPKEPESRTENKPADQTAASGGADGGRQFYDTQGCATCHAIGGKGGTSGPSLSNVGKRLSTDQLSEVIQKMRTGKSSMPPLPAGTTDQQVKDLTEFLATLSSEKQKQDSDEPKEPESRTENKPTDQALAVAAGGGGAGRQFYDTQGCAKCHAIGGKGGTSAPSLSDVGKRLSMAQLTEVVQKIRTGKSSMPPLPPKTTDQQAKALTDFLVTLTSDSQRQSGGKPKESETRTESKPAAEAAPSGTVAAGPKFYDTQGCAKCHAIGGKGGTSAPSLSDVGKRLSSPQLTEVVQKMRTGKSSMPPLPPGTTDQQAKNLVGYLASLTGQPQKENTDKPKAIDAGPVRVQTSDRPDPPTRQEIVNMIDAEASQGTTALPGALLLFLVGVTAVLIGVIVFRPGVTATPGGKILAFFGLFLLPLICAGMGTTYHIDRSKSTKFCLSCHEMEPFGKSLLVNDPTHLAAAHFQNHRVPADETCYTCHTNYAMFGGLRAKIGGLRHVYIHYLGTPPAPEAIRLYEPFSNRECLHCHFGARSFEEGATHNAKPYLLAALKSNAVSCLSSGCHQTVHNVRELNKAKFWKENP